MQNWTYSITGTTDQTETINSDANYHYITFETLASGTATVYYKCIGGDNWEGGEVVDLTDPTTVSISAPIASLKISPANLPAQTSFVATVTGRL